MAILEWEVHEDICANSLPISFLFPNQKKASNFHTADAGFLLYPKMPIRFSLLKMGMNICLQVRVLTLSGSIKKNLYAPVNRTVKASSLRAAYGDIILMITEQKLLHWRLLAAKRLSRSQQLSESCIWSHIINTPNMGRNCLIPWVLPSEAILMAIQCITLLRK